MSLSYQDSSFRELSEPDHLSDTYSQTGPEPLNQHDDDVNSDDGLEPLEEESAEDKWAKDLSEIREKLHKRIVGDISLGDEEWNSGSKDEQYKTLLDEYLELETWRPPLERPNEWEVLNCLQFVIKQIDGLRVVQFKPKLTMAKVLVRLIIASVSKKGSGHLLSLLQGSSDTKAVSETTKNDAAPSTLIAHDKEQGSNWDEKTSPLFMAIQCDKNAPNQSRGLTVFMCETLPEADRAKALAAKNKNNETWLHAAICADLEGVEKMIEWAPKPVFCERRRGDGLEDGNTPLHDALKYEKHIAPAPFPHCSGAHPKFEKRPVEFAPEPAKATSARSTGGTPCDACVAAARHFQNSSVRLDRIVNKLLERDIGALRTRNTSGRPPYLYYLHTRDMYIKEQQSELRGPSPAANTDFAGNPAKGKTSNPKSADDVDPAKEDNEPDKRNIPDRGKTSHNSKKLEDSKKSDNNKKSDETKKSGDNKKSDDNRKSDTNKRFDDKKTLDDLKKPNKIKTSEKELGTGNEPSPVKKQPENTKASDESQTPESNNKASLKSPIQPGKVALPDPEHNAIFPGDQNKEGPGLERKPVRRKSQVFGAENRLHNTSVKRSPRQATKFKVPTHRNNLPKRELAVNLEALLKETAYTVGGYKDAYECLFRTEQDDQDMGSDEEHRLQSWSLDTEEARISMHTRTDFDFFSFEPMMSSVKIDLGEAASEKELRGSTPDDKIIRWASMQKCLKDVFKWLKNNKKVKGIMRLVVRDRGPIFCSDETVEECLRGLEVRYLDWDRPDLCTDTLGRTPDLVQVDLYWSGSKAVLSSWGGTNGLRKLEKLRVVNLHAEKGRERIERTKIYVENFIAEAERDAKLPQIHAIYPDASIDDKNKNMILKTGTPRN
ncbi:MAG: hypothetical protein Q9208_001192, partial [Pyrenodesmia sp. 3 TL-2023]